MKYVMKSKLSMSLPNDFEPAGAQVPSCSNLFVIGGIWDLVLWRAYFYGRDEAVVGDLVIFSKAFGREDIAFIADLGAASGFNVIAYEDEPSLKEGLEKADYDNLFISHISDAFSSYVLRCNACASVTVLYEGLAAYVPPRAIHSSLHKIDRYIFYGESLPVPEFIPEGKVMHLSADRIKRSIDYFASQLSLEDSELEELRSAGLLIVGQHFYRHNLIDWDDEFNIYCDGISKYRDSTNGLVYWKEHPRSEQPFFPKLSARQTGLIQLGRNKLIPIELYASYFNKDIKIVGICSNTLFNLKDFFGFETLSLLNESIFAKFNYGRVERMALINFWGYVYLNQGASISPELLSGAFGYGLEAMEMALSGGAAKGTKRPGGAAKGTKRLGGAAKGTKRPNRYLRFFRRQINRWIKSFGMEIVYR